MPDVDHIKERGGVTHAAALAATYRLEARGVTKRFGATQALTDVDLTLRPGSIHALLGRNGAGKSTLVGVLTGLVEPDDGVVRFDGAPAPSRSNPRAWRELVGCVYQRPAMVPHLSVAENLLLNRYPGQRFGFLRWGELNREAARILDEWEIDIDPRVEAASLNVQERQLAEIACALSTGSRILLLDEPTAELDGQEIARLFHRIRRLRDGGVSFLYISHHLEEIYELCDFGTVLRDGRVVASGTIDELPHERVVAAMVGESGHVEERPRRRSAGRLGAAPSLSVRGLTRSPSFADISFDVAAGECVGLAGLIGSGRNAVAHSIAGLLRPDAGEVAVDGRSVAPGSVIKAIDAGIGYLPEDRHAAGFVPELSIADNLTMVWDRHGGRFGVTAPARRRSVAARLSARLDVAASSLDQPVASLSGGNQQKVALGRALATGPRVLVLAHPTSGVDIASKVALFGAVEAALAQDAAVLVVTDELDELALCTTVHVMFAGRIRRTFGAERSARELVAAIEGVEA